MYLKKDTFVKTGKFKLQKNKILMVDAENARELNSLSYEVVSMVQVGNQYLQVES
jgi:hypothetical protein